MEEDKETTNEIMAKSMLGLEISKSLCDASNAASTSYINQLTADLDGYASWALMDVTSGDMIQAYNKGKKEFRITLELKTDDVERAAHYFFDLDKRMKWEHTKWNMIKMESDYQDIVQMVCHCGLGKPKFVEYILHRNFKCFEAEQSIVITEHSLLLPQSEQQDVKRVHINACVIKLSEKVDTDAKNYVECQILVMAEDGYTNSVEYLKYAKKELESEVASLNKLLQE